MKEIVRSLFFGDDGTTVVCECRRCGTVASRVEAACSCCGADAIVEYTID